MRDTVKQDCVTILRAGIEAVDPSAAVKKSVSVTGDRLQIGGQDYNLSHCRNIFLIGAGKASAVMALAIEEILADRISDGVVITKYGHISDCRKITLVEAGHPVPDEAGFRGAQSLAQMAARCGEDDLVLCMISGGGSALLPLPVTGVSLEEKQETTKLLLNCGAAIHEINAVRKHLSQIKGGGLAHMVYPATLISLILSDVIGNDLDVIASGPTVPDRSTFGDCVDILKRYNISSSIPDSVRTHLLEGASGKRRETPKPGDPIFKKTQNLIIGSSIQCLEAAERKAREIGYNSLVLSSFVEGETREVAKVHSAVLKEVISFGRPVPRPACLISGGETTVTIVGGGKGGRNQEFVLSCGIDLAGWRGAHVFSVGTDGTDGPTDAAGAYADWRMVERAQELGLDAHDYLKRNDSYHFFKGLNDLIMTGPTKTNVMDLRLLIAT
ncbi:MAG: glycerate kinase [Deltaproteobacteria bacterium]|nr:glycerate kinase [Deltaproteobacteria bacterium]